MYSGLFFAVNKVVSFNDFVLNNCNKKLKKLLLAIKDTFYCSAYTVKTIEILVNTQDINNS